MLNTLLNIEISLKNDWTKNLSNKKKFREENQNIEEKFKKSFFTKIKKGNLLLQ